MKKNFSSVCLTTILLVIAISRPSGVHAGFCDGGILGITFLPTDFFYGWTCNDIINSMVQIIVDLISNLIRTQNKPNWSLFSLQQGTKLIDPTDPERKPDPTIPIPASFNTRVDHPTECATPIRNQVGRNLFQIHINMYITLPFIPYTQGRDGSVSPLDHLSSYRYLSKWHTRTYISSFIISSSM